jgi:hypothetical protein
MPPPIDPAGLAEGVRRLSLALPLPFCRIDVIETDRGFHYGELTPEPGNYQAFSPDVDQLLGTAYEQAEARLLGALGAGALDQEGIAPRDATSLRLASFCQIGPLCGTESISHRPTCRECREVLLRRAAVIATAVARSVRAYEC